MSEKVSEKEVLVDIFKMSANNNVTVTGAGKQGKKGRRTKYRVLDLSENSGDLVDRVGEAFTVETWETLEHAYFHFSNILKLILLISKEWRKIVKRSYLYQNIRKSNGKGGRGIFTLFPHVVRD